MSLNLCECGGEVDINAGDDGIHADKAVLLYDTDVTGYEYAAARDHYGKYLLYPNYNELAAKHYTEWKPYLKSYWATPVIVLEIGDAREEIECWIPETETEWDEHTHWPESARKILEGKK